MKIVKKVLIGIAALVVIILITAAFVNRECTVERSAVVNRPKDEVFAYLSQLKNQDRFSTFTMKDPAMKKSFKGTDATVGFIYAWDGNSEAGQGEQEITGIKPGERIDMELRFIRPMEGKANVFMSTEAVETASTRVTWGFQTRMPYPFNIMRLFIDVEEMTGKEIETSLGHLKKDLEK